MFVVGPHTIPGACHRPACRMSPPRGRHRSRVAAPASKPRYSHRNTAIDCLSQSAADAVCVTRKAATIEGASMTLVVLAYLGGVLTIVSPCILPVLPFVFARADRPFLRSGLPMLAGMVVMF